MKRNTLVIMVVVAVLLVFSLLIFAFNRPAPDPNGADNNSGLSGQDLAEREALVDAAFRGDTAIECRFLDENDINGIIFVDEGNIRMNVSSPDMNEAALLYADDRIYLWEVNGTEGIMLHSDAADLSPDIDGTEDMRRLLSQDDSITCREKSVSRENFELPPGIIFHEIPVDPGAGI